MLSIVLAVAILAARLIGSIQDTPFRHLITNPDGTDCDRPCLFGLYPGLSISEVIDLLKRHPLTNHQPSERSTDDRGRLSLRFIGPGVTLYLNFDGKQRLECSYLWFNGPSAKDVSDEAQAPTLAEVINLWGNPDFLETNGQSVGRLYYRDRAEVISLKGIAARRLDPHDLVSFMGLSGSPECYISERVAARWLGFTTLQHYRAKLRPIRAP